MWNCTYSYFTFQKNKHSTVIENVKNVQGWHKGAERGFTAIYPDTIHVLTDAVKKDVPDLAIWFRKVSTYFQLTYFLYRVLHYFPNWTFLSTQSMYLILCFFLGIDT